VLTANETFRFGGWYRYFGGAVPNRCSTQLQVFSGVSDCSASSSYIGAPNVGVADTTWRESQTTYTAGASGDSGRVFIACNGGAAGSQVLADDMYIIGIDAADLQITKTDGVTSAVPGQSITYTIVASNAGASDDPDVSLVDTFPDDLSCTWTSEEAGGASGNTEIGSDDLAETLNMPSGSSVTYTASCDIDPAATGTLQNTATVTASITDPNPGNNSDTDDDTVLMPEADLAVTKNDGACHAIPGEILTYTIQVTNPGPSDVVAAWVEDPFPAELTGCQWTCAPGGGASCTAGQGAGYIDDSADLPASTSVTYTAECTVDPGASFEQLTNTATVTPPAGVDDPDLGNNSASDTDVGPLAIFADCFESGDTTAWSSTVGGAKRLATVPSPGDELIWSQARDYRDQFVGHQKLSRLSRAPMVVSRNCPPHL